MSEAQVRFAVATFNALAAWSASSSLDEVHDVLAHIPQPGEAENRRLYTAAAACYEALWAAKQREEQRATLVRASVGPDEPLLRPAASARQPEDGGRLGRPAER
jgi:hypothetical protein